MRLRLPSAAVLLAALLVPSTAGAAGDPIMPLSEVRAGMQCTGYSVFRGQAVEPFGVEVIDVVGPNTTGGTQPRILFSVSGANIEATGIAQGFSGSPIYCAGADGTPRVIGAASEVIGEYGSLKALATPIEQIVGTPLTPTTGAAPKARVAATTGASASVRRGWARASRAHAADLRRAKPIATPLVLGGVSGPVIRGLQSAAGKRGVALLQASGPTVPTAPFAGFKPGGAVGTGYTTGELSLGGIGTVAYVDGANVWAFGHQLEGVGRRSLFLQDAAISTVIQNPTNPLSEFASYKLGASVADVGTLSSDGVNAVAGTTGQLPPSIPVHVEATDTDTGATENTDFRAADETALGNPSGVSGLSFGAPTAVLQIPTTVLGSAPVRTAGELCFQIRVRERKAPMRFCNRYVGDGLSGSADGTLATLVGNLGATDVQEALSLVDAFAGPQLHVTGVQAKLSVTRGQRMAYLRAVQLPRRVKRGTTVRGTFVIQITRGGRKRVPFRFAVPRKLRAGTRTLTFSGPGPDFADGSDALDELIIDLGGGGEKDENTEQTGPRTVKALASRIHRIESYDGVRLNRPRTRVYRDDDYRIGGRAQVTVRVR